MTRAALLLAWSFGLAAQEASDVPLGLNLPTAQSLGMGDVGLRFTHRFTERARSNGTDAYGLDGYAFAGLGLDFSFKGLRGWNLQLYRTADQRTFTLAVQKQVWASEAFRAAVRVERYDEVVKDNPSTVGLREGKVGATVLVPLEALVGDLTFSLVPAYLNRSATQPDPIATVAAAVRWDVAEHHRIHGEYYPRPGKLSDTRVAFNSTTRALEPGWALGYTYRTRGHRFSLLATNVLGTTAHQVLSGDTNGLGPAPSGDWVLGFNVVRIF
ncbi:MAG: DUF5777 family beta-barrel protein [Holophagaceae bacterium]